MTAPKVVVLVLNWNGWQDTLECLASLTELDYPNYEVYVVDNASTDDSGDRIRDGFPDMPLIVTDENRGFAYGNSVALDRAVQAGAEYIWMLNNDAVPAPDALTAMTNVAVSSPDVGAVGSVVLYYDRPDTVQVWGGGRVNLWLGTTHVHTHPCPPGAVHYASGTSLLLRLKAVAEVGFLDPTYFMYWEDTDLGLRMRRLGWRVVVADRARVWHKGSSSTGGGDSLKSYELYLRSSLTFFRRHALVPVIPISIRFFGACLKWFLQRDWRRLGVVLRTVSL